MRITFFIILFVTNIVVAQDQEDSTQTIDVLINYIHEKDNSIIKDPNIRITIFEENRIFIDTVRKDTLPILFKLKYNQIYEVESSINGKYLFHKTNLGFQKQRNINQISKTFKIQQFNSNNLAIKEYKLPPYKIAKQDTLISWNNLRFRSKEVYLEKYFAYGKKPILTKNLISLEGKTIVVHGFLKTFNNDNKIILYKPGTSFDNCIISPEEEIYGNSKLIEINMLSPLIKTNKNSEKEVYIKGVIELNIDDPTRCNLILNNSVILYSKEPSIR